MAQETYHDIDDIQRLVTLPDEAHHRNVDKIVQSAISDAVRVVILCPPTIYGTGSGPVNTRSVQVPDIARNTLQNGFAPFVGAGKTEWDNVHINDLGDLFVRLVDATQDPSLSNNPEVFGTRGYFFAENGSHKWSDVAAWVAEEASRQGYLPAPTTKSVTQEEVEQLSGVATASYGQNSKGVAQRAKKYLGWEPKGPALKDEIESIVAKEAKSLKLTPKEKGQ